MSFKRIVIIVFILFGVVSLNGATLKGTIQLGEDWAPVLYVSVIPSFDDLYTSSYDLLRYRIELDSTGIFEVNQLELSPDDLLYRIHITKKGDPESTIIIGGQEENFIHLIMNDDSEISIQKTDSDAGFHLSEVSGHPSLLSLNSLFSLKQDLETPPRIPSENNRQFIRDKILQDFTNMADTSSFPIIRLMAIHFIGESFTNTDPFSLMQGVKEDLIRSHHESPYFSEFIHRLDYLNYRTQVPSQTKLKWLIWVLLPMIAGIIYLIRRKKSIHSDEKLKSLSIQEKRVFDLLKLGKSNKEISSELHIEISTVKSHLHRIYNRLGVKSRKEIVNGDF